MSAARTIFWSLSWVPVAVTFTQTIGQPIVIQGRSMQPTLNPDSSLGRRDWVLLQKYGLRSDLHRGDVVVLRSPSDPNKVLIKRIIACGGDNIKPRDASNYPKQQLKIPPSHLWVEGDYVHSQDSNDFGPISSGLVMGKARYILWPPSRWGPIPPSSTDAETRVE